MSQGVTYWLNLFTGKTWQEFLDHGAATSGFRESRWSTVKQIREGDILLCYLTGVSRWIGALEVTSKPFQDTTPIWEDEVFPCRVGVKMTLSLTPETAIPVHSLGDELSMFQNLKSPIAWTGSFRGSPARWKPADGQIVMRAVRQAHQHPIVRQFDQRKLDRRPKTIASKLGPVVVPDADFTEYEADAPLAEASAHTEIQWRLLKLGNDLGLSIWSARNDKGRSFGDQAFADLPRFRTSLPHQFDEATNRIIEHIDVLWLNGNAIEAAFEIESTTSIYSGLLRMSDLISMQPNLNIPLYIVAPQERREKVIAEVNRPTFSRLTPPMRDMCRFISFTGLRDRIDEISPWVQYMKPDLLIELSESCDSDES